MTDAGVPFGNYQYEIYLKGVGGETPGFPMGWADLESAAAAAMDEGARGYVFGSAGTQATERANLAAFDRWRIVPRMLRDVAERDTRTELFGATLPAPLMLAPVGVQSIVHPEGELAVARAAAATGVPMVASTAASHSLEEIAEANGADGLRWYQLYWPNTKELTASFLSRAEAAGYGAIVVTLDTPLLAWRPRDLQGAYLPFLRAVGIANYLSDPVFREGLERSPEEDPQAAVGHFIANFSNPSSTWDDLAGLHELTSLPILLKGINHADDARRAVECGIDGVIVSNHGGRQVDGAIAALDALPDVVATVGDALPVLFDSGIRSGADIVKALALGARAVLVGRPYVWGLAVGGEAGVVHVLKNLLAELDLTLALSGHTSPATLDPSVLRAAVSVSLTPRPG